MALGAPQPDASGKFSVKVGSPLQHPKKLASGADQVRGTVMDMPVLLFAVGYLYYKTFISGEPNRSFTITDAILVVAIAYGLKRFGVASRWGGA